MRDLILADMATLIAIGLSALVWVAGARRLSADGEALDRRQAGAFVLGLLIAMVVVSPPIDALISGFFSLHMLQHLVLIGCAAPLIAWSRPGPVVRAAVRIRTLSPSSSEAAWASAALFALAILLWHLPAFHDWALGDPIAHCLEHLSVLGAAIGFWRFVVFAGEKRSRGMAILIVWLISLQGALLSAVIMFAPVQLCRSYAGNPLTDQILAGLLMCIPASLLYAGTSVWALVLLFHSTGNVGQPSKQRAIEAD